MAEGFHTYSPAAIKQLFDGHRVSHILCEGDDAFLAGSKAGTAMRRISVSGAQEKFPAVIEEGIIRIAGDEEQSTYILKPYPWDELLLNRKLIPANEHLTMQVASQVYGIQTAANGLCFTGKGQPVYITRRFDIKPDFTKTEMEDFATLEGRNEQTDGKYFKYSNTSLHVAGDDFGLDGGLSPKIEKSDAYEKSGHPCRTDFERFGELIGLPSKRISRILDRYMVLPELTKTLTLRSFLNDKMKRIYLRIVNERIARFKRQTL